MTALQRRDFIRLSGKATTLILIPFTIAGIFKYNTMTGNNTFDVIIVGGSYSGLAAGMALGRALKNVLIIDDRKPCNRQTPHSHNFLTNDGKTPGEIAAAGKLQVMRYDTVKFFGGTAVNGKQTGEGFEIEAASGETFAGKKLIFATGIRDILPPIAGLTECWGISVIHCPYCHGYEVRNEKTGVLGNGDMAFDFTRLISNWTKDLTLFTNGTSALTVEQRDTLQKHQIKIVEKEMERLEHNNGYLRNIIFKDGSQSAIKAIYAPAPFEQHCKIPGLLGCNLTEEGYIKIDGSQETSVEGVYAIGDNAAKMRTVANAVAMGTAAGITISKKMILEEFG
jgi:thioredoxin reductase